jgi:alkaline phosphatase D
MTGGRSTPTSPHDPTADGAAATEQAGDDARSGPTPLTRRAFLIGAASLGVAACTGNSDDDADDGAADGGPTTGSGARPATPPPPLAGPPFTLGVASGDPLPDRVILWTRLAPEPLEVGGGMPDEDVDVEWEVAADDSFTQLVVSGVAVAGPQRAHTVHVDAAGLEPDTWYAYRFRVGDEVSPVGRTRTAPPIDSSPEQLRLAVANCQDFAGGYFAAYRDIASQDFDAVLFLGDYIYEAPGPDDPDEARAERKNLGGPPASLDDYRRRYAWYRLDHDLQDAHAACPWIVTFDDHEVINNYAGDDGAQFGSGPDFAALRAVAYQAWWEHLPMRIDPPEDTDISVHREIVWGDLADLFVMETRSDADPPPCRDTSNFDAGPTCAERDDPSRSALGAAQKEWLFEGLAAATAQWTVLGNPVLMAGLDIAPPGQPGEYWLETWDGYPVERRELAEWLIDQQVPNPIVLTGDYHAAFVNVVKPDPWDPAAPVAAPELLATSVSSGLYGYDYTGVTNPQIQWFDGEHHGYLDCVIGRDSVMAHFRTVDDVGDPRSGIGTAATFEVTPGAPPEVRQV